jgi:2-keto-4-pentenoate hydratase/2-oxohepta-3-ene-1,7-dioic acid hydratase in catechol pathway
MRLLTFTATGRTAAGLEVNGFVVDLARAASALPTARASLPGDLREILEIGDEALQTARRIQEWVASALTAGQRPTGPDGQAVVYEVGQVKINAPIPRPGKIICLGLNYADHAAESGSELPKSPLLFAKFANTIIGTGDPIILPRASKKVDYEAELAFVIGRRAKHVPLDRAMDYVAGYMNLNDVSARDLQQETSQFFKGKSPDTFAPCGPYLVTRDEIPDPHGLDIRCYVNGELMQNSNTRQLIFNIPFLVHHISRTITLEPGDIISTGTPSGVGMARKPPRFLKPGDVVRVEVAGLGVLENPVIAEPE